MSDKPSIDDDASDDRRMVINGRRWRKTDPSLPTEIVEQLKSHLGRGRSGVRAAKQADDTDAVAAARHRVGIAKHGLGERGPYWWDDAESNRLARANDALQELNDLDPE